MGGSTEVMRPIRHLVTLAGGCGTLIVKRCRAHLHVQSIRDSAPPQHLVADMLHSDVQIAYGGET